MNTLLVIILFYFFYFLSFVFALVFVSVYCFTPRDGVHKNKK